MDSSIALAEGDGSIGRPGRGTVPVRAVVATIVGNWLEFYDFITYSYFAVMIGRQFFPAESPSASLLLSVATFGAGFLTRPLGAAVIGAYADRAGRKPAMTLTILLMATGTGILGLTPSYAAIGVAAPVIVVLARLLQGFSCGGEMGPATTYLVEAAPAGWRARLTMWQGLSQGLASIMGTSLGFALTELLTPAQVDSWGWRVPFLIGILIGPVGLYIRRQLPETLDERMTHRSARAVLGELLRHHSRAILCGIMVICGGTVSTYIHAYFTTFAITTLHLPASTGMLGTLLASIMSLIGLPIGAWAADRLGFKRSIILPRLCLMALTYPAYVAITRAGASVGTVLGIEAGLYFIAAVSGGAFYALIASGFPSGARSSGLSILYALSVTIFGGTTQYVVTWLLHVTGDPLVPAFYLIGADVVTLTGVVLSRPLAETPRR